MELVHGIISVAATILTASLLTRILRPSNVAESVLLYFSFFTAHIIVIGFLLSLVNRLGSLAHWSLFSLASLAIILMVVLLNRNLRKLSFQRVPMPNIQAIRHFFAQISSLEKALLIPLLFTTISLSLMNLVAIAFRTPHNWDSMTYHLARVAYYIQHGNFNYYDANYWAQVVHPKNSALLMLYTFLVTGRNENLMQLVQFISYWVAVVSVYGISRKIGNGKSASLFSGLIFALLVECLMEAVTTQNDMLLTALVGSAVYFLFAFMEAGKRKYLALAAVNLGLAAGVKSSIFLVLPSLLIVAAYTMTHGSSGTRQFQFGNLAMLLASLFLAVCAFALPSGYLENYLIFGSPLGPENVREVHAFEDSRIGYIATNGTKNLLRYGFGFLALDGLPGIEPVIKVERFMRGIPAGAIGSLGIDLEASQGVREDFHYHRKDTEAYEDHSSWGILGFALVWVVILLLTVGILKSPCGRLLSIATIVFVLAQAYSGPYDPWRGRYFITAGVFAAPAVGILLGKLRNRNLKILNAYVIVIVLLGCVSGWTSIIFRLDSSLLPLSYKQKPEEFPTVFGMDRLGELTASRPQYYKPLKKYEELVPRDAVVAVYLPPNSFEYPLFGERLTRKIIPINSFWRGIQPIPEEADYLLYANGFPNPSPTDILLGRDWHLRKLTENEENTG